ncbi:pentapeptide repeat-containing protein [Streptomyces lydicus]|uniref:pentapeptide repeat-containing protein n=1 Tax=Streptomyces lydicus TaxID=47763 RepID=UPI003405021F
MAIRRDRDEIVRAVRAGVSFKGADLRGVNLAGADLRNADFEDAALTGANLTGANAAGAKLIGADLTRLTADWTLLASGPGPGGAGGRCHSVRWVQLQGAWRRGKEEAS